MDVSIVDVFNALQLCIDAHVVPFWPVGTSASCLVRPFVTTWVFFGGSLTDKMSQAYLVQFLP